MYQGIGVHHVGLGVIEERTERSEDSLQDLSS